MNLTNLTKIQDTQLHFNDNLLFICVGISLLLKKKPWYLDENSM